MTRCLLWALLTVPSVVLADWEEQAKACIARLQDAEQRTALEQRADFLAEEEVAEKWNERVYEQLPDRLADSEHPHDQLLLRWLIWARETRAAGAADNPLAAASGVDHARSTAIMDRLARSESQDPLVLAATMIACPAPGEDIQPGDYCGEALDTRFQQADPGNAYPWLQSAQRAWASGQIDRAFELLARVADSDHMDWYYGDSQVAVADRLRVHLADQEVDDNELALMAQTLGPQIVGYPGFLALSQQCDAEIIAGNESRIQACVSAIEALSGNGASLMDLRVATGLAQVVAPALVRTPQDGLKEWAKLQNRNVEELQARVAGIGCLSLEKGPDAYQALYGLDYLKDVAEMGEFRAQQALVERFGAASDHQGD